MAETYIGLIPTEELSILQSQTAGMFDTTLDWYPALFSDIHGDREWTPTPTKIPGRIVHEQRQVYKNNGQQVEYSTDTIYVPYNTAIGPLDKLAASGTDVGNVWPPILEITPMPSPAAPIVIRVLQGAA